MTASALLSAPLLLSLLTGCSGKGESAADTAAADSTGGTSDTNTCAPPASTTPDDPICQQEYSFCGDIIPPAAFTGAPRSLAIALYTTVPPAGPPDAILAEIEAPALAPCERFPVIVQPMLETGEYYVWANLYMEGGGSFIPVNGVDYTGVTDSTQTFDGSPFLSPDLRLNLASGW